MQVALLPVGQAHHEPSMKLAEQLIGHGVRVDVDRSDESVGKKIRNAEMYKIPYMLVIGDKEKDLQTLAVRARGSKETTDISLDDFIILLKDKIQERSLDI